MVKKGSMIFNGETIPVTIKEYKTAKSVKIFIKNETVIITKPIFVTKKELKKILMKNMSKIYEEYQQRQLNETKHWQTGETILYKGEEFQIVRNHLSKNLVKIDINEMTKVITVFVPIHASEEDIKGAADKLIKKILKCRTEEIINKRLPYWSQVTGIEYKNAKVRDATTKYGSCVPAKKTLHFNARLIMLSPTIVDSVIVHELCHMVYRNHSQDFYQLVKKYIPNYDEIHQWLKKNNKAIMF